MDLYKLSQRGKREGRLGGGGGGFGGGQERERGSPRESRSKRKKGIRVIHHGEVSCPGLPSPGSCDRSHCRPHFIIAQPTVIESPQGGRSSWSRKRERARGEKGKKKRLASIQGKLNEKSFLCMALHVW